MRYVLFFLMCSSLWSNPKGPEVISGNVTFFNPSFKVHHVHTGQNAVINWDDFSIAIDETMKFFQPSSSSIVINRIIGDHMSEIMGALKANGKVFLFNQKGILFGEDAVVLTGGFTASTFDVLDQDIFNHRDVLFSGSSKELIVNLGTIKSRIGNVTLLAHRIENAGEIIAPRGEVSIFCGHEILMKVDKEKSFFIRPQQEGEPCFENTGSIEAGQMNAMVVGNPYSYAIKHEGTIDATGIREKEGRVILVADGGSNYVSSKIKAENGVVHILGEKVRLFEEAVVDVSSNEGAGTVLVGGDFQG